MFSNKELIEIKKELNELKKKFNDDNKTQISETNEIKKELTHIKKELEKLSGKYEQKIPELSEELKKLAKLNNTFESRVNSLKTIEKNIGKEFIDKTEKKINEKFQFLDNINNKYKILEKELKSTTNQISNVNTQIDRLITISKSIKERDFDLVNFARELQKEQKEKIELIKENERIKKAIAHKRRY